MKPNFIRIAGASLLLFALGQPVAHAYTHPCIPTTREELDTLKANLDKEPWKSGYAILSNAVSYTHLTLPTNREV